MDDDESDYCELLEEEDDDDESDVSDVIEVVHEDVVNPYTGTFTAPENVALKNVNVELLRQLAERLTSDGPDRIKSVLVIGGAGISTAAGLPDFRSEGQLVCSPLGHYFYFFYVNYLNQESRLGRGSTSCLHIYN